MSTACAPIRPSLSRPLPGSLARWLLAMACAAASLVQPAGRAVGDASPLACRLANYGEYQDLAWTHLPSIGVHHVFLSAPAPGEVEATQKRLADHGLTAVVLRGDADLTRPDGLDRLAT